MARTKQTARRSSGGKAPRRQMASMNSPALRSFMTSQQSVGTAMRAGQQAPRAVSYLNHENVLGSFGFNLPRSVAEFEPSLELATVANPQTGLPEHWMSVQFASKLDGDGMAATGRPPLSLCLVLDISGSMSMNLEGDVDAAVRRSKLDSSKLCVNAILEQLTAADHVSVLLFNTDTHVLQPAAPATAAAKAAIRRKLAEVRPGGGTALERGFAKGMDAVAAAAEAAPEAHALRRVYFLTDMQSSPSDETAVLLEAGRRAEAASMPIHTTIVGMGVDLSVGTVERLSSLRGGKYLSVSNTADFVASVGSDFSHDVVPTAFAITLEAKGGWTFERACGSAELNSMPPGSTRLEMSSEFATPLDDKGEAMGAVLLVKLRAPDAPATATEAAPSTTTPPPRRTSSRRSPASAPFSASAAARTLEVGVSWQTPQGLPASADAKLAVPPLGAALLPVPRKALALARFVDIQANFAEGNDSEGLEVRAARPRCARLAQSKAGRASLLADMAAVGDDSLRGRNANLLETLDQIIQLEEREVREMQEARDKAARGKRGRAGGDGRRGKAARREPPEAYLCAISKTLMADPVCTADGHTFERASIETWLTSHDTSPLTGLRLASKSLTPNHMVRSLIKEWQEGA